MTDQELENRIRKSIENSGNPTLQSFLSALNTLGLDADITKISKMRYIKERGAWIIAHKIRNFFNTPRSRFTYLMPSFIVVFIIFVGAFNLSPLSSRVHDQTVEQLAQENEALEEKGMDTDDILMVTSFDEPDIYNLSTAPNEL